MSDNAFLQYRDTINFYAVIIIGSTEARCWSCPEAKEQHRYQSQRTSHLNKTV